MEVRINNKTIVVPQSWNELSFRQLLICYSIIMVDLERILESNEIMPFKRIELVKALLTVENSFMERWEQDCITNYGEEEGQSQFLAELQELFPITDFLFDKIEEEDQPVKYQVRLGLTKCPYPELGYTTKKNKKKVWLGPKDELSNISFIELATTFTLFESFMETGEEEYVDQLIATLYRPIKPATSANKRSGYQGDRRLPFLCHESTVDKRIEKVKLIPDTIKQLLTFWFASCRQHIIASYENIFSAPGDGIKGEKTGNDYGWGGVLMSLAGGLESIDKIAGQPYQNALTYLSFLEDQRKLAEMKIQKEKGLGNSPVYFAYKSGNCV